MPTQAEVNALVETLPEVGKLVHLAYRLDLVHFLQIKAWVQGKLVEAFEWECQRLGRNVGCFRQVKLTNGAILRELERIADAHAESIVNTFNRDLVFAIRSIREEAPKLNRYGYAKRLLEWDARRGSWKDQQIALMTYQTGTQRGREEWLSRNQVDGVAVLQPRKAAEPECQALIDAGEHPVSIVNEAPMPLHYNCIHRWQIYSDRVSRERCKEFWVGE